MIAAKTSDAVQINWKLPCEFPCCPQGPQTEPLHAYAEKLITGSIFCQNDTYASIVCKYAITDHGHSLYVLAESKDGNAAIKTWALAKITYENDLFVHTNLRTYFNLAGAEKQFCLVQGLPWDGGNTIDDYC